MEDQNAGSLQQQSELEKKSESASSDSTGPITPSAKDANNAGASEPIPTSSNSSTEPMPIVDTGTITQEEIADQVKWDKEHPTQEEQERAKALEDHRAMQAGRTMEELNPHLTAPPSKPHEEPKKAVAGGPTQPSRDEDKLDSLGNPKFAEGDSKLVGPRGANVSPEHLSEEQKAESEKKRQEREHRGMSSTAKIDSAGNSKHIYRHEPQGHNKHGMRLPDRNTGELVEESPKHVGPRGTGVPKDTFHRG